jgi:hypothetical protein
MLIVKRLLQLKLNTFAGTVLGLSHFTMATMAFANSRQNEKPSLFSSSNLFEHRYFGEFKAFKFYVAVSH